MNADLIVFYILSAVTVIGALGVVLDRNVVRATLMLLIALLGVAGIFLTAFAEFLALAQILLYGGAVTIDVLFNQWAIPFEIASVVLLVAMIGAIALAPSDDPDEPDASALQAEPPKPPKRTEQEA